MVALEFRLLGEVAVVRHGSVIDLGHARQRCVLAALVVDAGRVVPVDALLNRVWADNPPRHARNAVAGYVSRLRQVLVEVRLSRADGGYGLEVDPLSVDLHRFRHLTTQARTATDDTVALDRFEQALCLWQGEAFATADSPWLRNMRTTLNAERLTAVLARNDLALRLGRHSDLLGELTGWADAHPLDERLAGQLMHALYLSGRQADALRHYESVRSALADELGTDPSPPLRELHCRILNADPSLTMRNKTAVNTSRGELTHARYTALVSSRLVGRDAELAFLGAALADAGARRGGAVFLVGEPGLGKTRLVRELVGLATASKCVVVQGRATSPATQFRPLAEALFSVLRHGGMPDDPELAPYQRVLSRLVPEWRTQPMRGADDSLVVLAEAVLRVLRRLGRDNGCLVVLDDLHDADVDTLEVIGYLVDNLAGEPVLFVGTTRPDPGRTMELVRAAERRRVVTTVELSPLADAEVRVLIGACLGVDTASLPVEVVDRMLEDSEGNPFYVEELLAGLVSGGDLVRSVDGWCPTGQLGRRVPAAVLASVTDRVERLGRHGPRVLRAAAVFGQRFPASLVRVVAEVDDAELLDVLRSGVGHRLIVAEEDGSYSFRHALTARALQTGLLPQERAALAYRAAKAIEDTYPNLPDDWSLVAGEMWQLAGESHRAAELFGQAGRHAAAQGGLGTAIELLERSLELMATGRSQLPPAAAPVLELLFDALVAAGRITRATEVSARLSSIATPGMRLTIQLGLTRAAVTAGQWSEGRQTLAQARRLLRPEAGTAETAAVDVVAARLAFIDPAPGRLAEMEKMAARALAAATRAELPEIACESLIMLGRCARRRNLDEAEALFARGLRIAEQHKLTQLRMQLLFQLAAHVGIRSADATPLIEARNEAAAAGALVTAIDITGELALLHLIHGEYDEAERCARECEDSARRFRLRPRQLVGLALRVCVRAHQGRRAAATELLASYERLGGQQFEYTPGLWNTMAICSLLEEDREQALAYLDRAAEAEASRPTQLVPSWHGPRLFLAVLEGREGRLDYEAAKSSPTGQSRWNRTFLALAAAVLASREHRQDAANRAVAEFRTEAEPLPLAYHLGLRLLAEAALDGRWADPGPWLREAEAYFHAMRVPRIAAACRTLISPR
jgi:DNA-binding SARP family transcriptional activator/tetratricopeptide (TPR) repeat protein